MEVHTVSISRSDALQKVREYRNINSQLRTSEDDRLQKLYKAVSNGARVINVAEAFRSTGLDTSGRPKLAIARGDWKTVRFHANAGHSSMYDHSHGGGKFSDGDQDERWRPTQDFVVEGVFNQNDLRLGSVKSPVPHVPPGCRPRYSRLANFHILFEVEAWAVDKYPRDPFLLRRIEGDLFVVEAEWELTELEAMLLGAMRGGGQ